MSRQAIRKYRAPWASCSDERLLGLRLCDLGLSCETSAVWPAVQELYGELESRGLKFRPHVWLSNEWFTPDEVPGIAVPFYLAHPRLGELERAQMLDVEGGTHDWCMRILRHEAGHAFDNAYRLHRRKTYRSLFGSYAAPYPHSYRPRPYTKQFVQHLDLWYAQSHPAEDFAETFAVWLNPRGRWRQEYEAWPALRKLQFVDDVVREIGAQAAPVSSRRRHKHLSTLRTTLRDYYARKRSAHTNGHPRFYDRDLYRLFSADAKFARRLAADAFLNTVRGEVRMMVSRWTGESQFTIDRTLADMTTRVRTLGLRLRKAASETKSDVMMMLAVQTMNYLNDGRHRVSL